MPGRLGKSEAALLAYAQMRGQRVLHSGELREPLHLSALQEQALLTRMVRRGLIAQVRRGLYLIPARLPLGGRWTPDEAIALNALMGDRSARYQVTGPTAFRRYGFDEQVPARTYAYNDRISGERTIDRVALTLIKVHSDRLGHVEEQRTREGEIMVYSSRARTLMDAIYEWRRFDTLPRAFDWIRHDLEGGRIRAGDLVECSLRYGNQGTIRRIGAILEQAGTRKALLRRLEGGLRSSASMISMVPGRSRHGRVDRRWGVVRND